MLKSKNFLDGAGISEFIIKTIVQQKPLFDFIKYFI